MRSKVRAEEVLLSEFLLRSSFFWYAYIACKRRNDQRQSVKKSNALNAATHFYILQEVITRKTWPLPSYKKQTKSVAA